jgi:hypothetical protein
MMKTAEVAARQFAVDKHARTKSDTKYDGQYGTQPPGAYYRSGWTRRLVVNCWTPLRKTSQSQLVYADRRSVDMELTCPEYHKDLVTVKHDGALLYQSKLGVSRLVL